MDEQVIERRQVKRTTEESKEEVKKEEMKEEKKEEKKEEIKVEEVSIFGDIFQGQRMYSIVVVILAILIAICLLFGLFLLPEKYSSYKD